MRPNVRTRKSNGNFALYVKLLCFILAVILLAIIPLSGCSNVVEPPEEEPTNGLLNDERFSVVLSPYSRHYMIRGRGNVPDADIIIPDTAYDIFVTVIGDRAFKNDTLLASVKMTDRMITIGVESFYGCVNLKTINLPKALEDIGENAFYGCTSLSSITYDGTVADWSKVLVGEGAFTNVKATQIVCKDGVITIK